MKIIIDNKIPYIKEAVQTIADEIIYAPGKDFTPKLVQDADALIIRTRTHCNQELLEGSRVVQNKASVTKIFTSSETGESALRNVSATTEIPLTTNSNKSIA